MNRDLEDLDKWFHVKLEPLFVLQLEHARVLVKKKRTVALTTKLTPRSVQRERLSAFSLASANEIVTLKLMMMMIQRKERKMSLSIVHQAPDFVSRPAFVRASVKMKSKIQPRQVSPVLLAPTFVSPLARVKQIVETGMTEIVMMIHLWDKKWTTASLATSCASPVVAVCRQIKADMAVTTT